MFPVGSSPFTRGTLFGTSIKNIIDRFIPAYAGNSLRPHFSLSETSVHPRLRGELPVSPQTRRGVCGSSPLTRGTRGKKNGRHRKLRFIPAYAGNSPFPGVFSGVPTVHPRLRGELLQTAILCNLNHGSSPLTRGTLVSTVSAGIVSRFIPAYAGNSNTLSTHDLTPDGSSPLTRGTLLLDPY